MALFAIGFSLPFAINTGYPSPEQKQLGTRTNQIILGYGRMPVVISLGGLPMERTTALKAVRIETARMLTGRDRRHVLTRTVEARGSGEPYGGRFFENDPF